MKNLIAANVTGISRLFPLIGRLVPRQLMPCRRLDCKVNWQALTLLRRGAVFSIISTIICLYRGTCVYSSNKHIGSSWFCVTCCCCHHYYCYHILFKLVQFAHLHVTVGPERESLLSLALASSITIIIIIYSYFFLVLFCLYARD